MNNDKIRISGEDFYVISQCQTEGYTLCVAADQWGRSEWGIPNNGQLILEVADNRHPLSTTNAWYSQLPEEIKSAMLTIEVTADEYGREGKGFIEETEMFVPSSREWSRVPLAVRRKMACENGIWSRSLWNSNDNGSRACYVSCGTGTLYGNTPDNVYYVFPAFYLRNDVLEKMEKLPEDVELGSFTADVRLMPNGTFDVWTSHDGSTKCHYRDILSAEEIGKLVADDISCVVSLKDEQEQ